MEIRAVQTFLAVVEFGSFTAAAKHMGVTQAAISQRVAALERELQVPLFERTSRRVQLTERGGQLVEYGQRMVALQEEALQAITGSPAHLQGLLKVAASTVPAECLLPELLARFREHHPAVRESLLVSDSSGATEAILRRDADLGFVGEKPSSRRLKVEELTSDELVLVVAPQHPWAARKSVAIEALCAEPWIMREPGSGTRLCVENSLAARGIRIAELQIVIEVNSNDAIRAAVQRNAGVAFLSSRVARQDLEARRMVAVRVRTLRASRMLYVVRQRGRELRSPAREFLEFVQQAR
jgi:DNA-binding transcriptional LysR family regulator